MKYMLYIDYKSTAAYKYKELAAKTLEDAITEADNLWNDQIYLARIMAKDGRTETPERGLRSATYTAILCRRSNGWHRNTTENCEAPHRARRTWTTSNPAGAWTEAI